MSTPSWKEHFQIQVTGFDPVEAQGLSELGFAVMNQKIDEQEYLSWARSAYELVSVDMNFFQKNPPPVALISKLKEVYPWGPEIFPVAEWDGHTLILTFDQPTTPLPVELKPILLLAPISQMSECWQKVTAAIEASLENAIEIEAPVEVLEGISLEAPTAVTNIDFSELRTSPTIISDKPAEIPTKIDIEAVQVAIPSEVTQVPQMKSAPMQEEPIIPVKAVPQIISVASSSSHLDADKIKKSFQQYKHIYDHRCFIEINLKTKKYQVTIWPEDSNMIVSPTQHDLQSDSFVKIVSYTQKPYHGHIVNTPSTEKFFKEVNSGKIPENVTAIPLISNNEVLGILLGWGPKSTYNHQTLRELESVVQNLSSDLGFVTTENAA